VKTIRGIRGAFAFDNRFRHVDRGSATQVVSGKERRWAEEYGLLIVVSRYAERKEE
jgi:hypothetical protein